MSKTRIVLASVLKPVNDTRMFEKFGLTLSELPDTEVHIIGFHAPVPDAPENIHFHPVFNFNRLSPDRLSAQLIFFRLLKKINPDLIIIQTHELLGTALAYKFLEKCMVMYDVQENYYLNLTKQNVFPAGIKHLLAGAVRSTEWLSSNFIDHYFLAEKSYASELPFLHEKYTILENKYKALSVPKPTVQKFPVTISGCPIKLLFSGTISELNGVFEAVQLSESLHRNGLAVELTIIGYCAQEKVFEKLIGQIKDKPYIRLIGGQKLVPHSQIIDQISQNTYGLLPYRPNPSTWECIPTKLFEYMAYALPVIVQQNKNWENLVLEHKAGFLIDFQNYDQKTVQKQLQSGSYYPNGIPKDVFWEPEAEKLIKVVTGFLENQNILHS